MFILSEALGVGYSLSSNNGYDIDANQELIALGVSNVAAACLGGLVSGCSVSSTAVNDRAGAKSQVSSLAVATMVLVTLVELMPLFRNLPQAILSAIVIHAVARMMRVAELKRFYRFHPSEFGLALGALLGVITVGILPGLGIAVVLSLVRFIWGASHLSFSRLGPVPGKEHSYQIIGDAVASIPGLEILRLDGPLFFANALRFRNEVRQLLSGSTSPNAIVINLHANFGIDLSATDTLSSLVAEAEKTNTEILFAELQDPVRQMFRRCGLLDRVGDQRVLPTVDDAVQNYLNRYPAARHAEIASRPLSSRGGTESSQTRRWREMDSNPRSPVSGSTFSENCSRPANGQAPAIAANGALMASTERCCSASAFMDNTGSLTLKGWWSPTFRPRSCRSTLRITATLRAVSAVRRALAG